MTQGVVDLFNRLAKNDFGFFQRIGPVSDLMTRDVTSLTLDDTFRDAVELFHKNPFHHAPVIDADKGDVVGILSDRDVLRFRPPVIGSAADPLKKHPVLEVPVTQFMTRKLVAVSADATPEDALTLMLDNHIDCVLVHDKNRNLQGILTVRDFMKMVLLFHQVCTATPELVRLRLVDLDMTRGLPLDFVFSRGARSVRDVMSLNVTTIRPTIKVRRAMELMQSEKVRHLPVTEGNGRLQGIVTDRNILRFLPVPKPKTGKEGPESGFREHLFKTDDEGALATNIASVTTAAAATVRPDALFVDAITLMLDRDLSALTVLDNHDDHVCGIFTTTDVMRVLRVAFRIGALVRPQ